MLSDENYRFVSMALPGDTFSVVHFNGHAAINDVYSYDVTLVSKRTKLDLAEVLENPVSFSILLNKRKIQVHGVLKHFEQLHAVDEYCFYRAHVVAKLWWLTQRHHNQIFLDKTVPEILEAVLLDGGLTKYDFEFRLQREYKSWEYVCQYRESNYDFFLRWCEHEGIYFFFEQAKSRARLVITDSKMAHTEMGQGEDLEYAPPAGLEPGVAPEVVSQFTVRQKSQPASVRLRDYNYRTPSLELMSTAVISDNDSAEVYVYGDHFHTPSGGDALAKVRAEMYRCQSSRAVGKSTVPMLRPGYLFHLKGHFNKMRNKNYLCLRVRHRGSQAAYLLAGIQAGVEEEDIEPFYENTFEFMPAELQYRPRLTQEKPRFHGLLNAVIDAAESGEYAELDEQGRYKIIMPFDLSGRDKGKATHYLRMMQPHAGAGYGFHFPLHKGTEVLVGFINGDPDRPVIVGATPNPETRTPVTRDNQTQSMIKTRAGNVFRLEDRDGQESVLHYCPQGNTRMVIGRLSGLAEFAAGAASGGGSGTKSSSLKSTSVKTTSAGSTSSGSSTEDGSGSGSTIGTKTGADAFENDLDHCIDTYCPDSTGHGLYSDGTQCVDVKDSCVRYRNWQHIQFGVDGTTNAKKVRQMDFYGDMAQMVTGRHIKSVGENELPDPSSYTPYTCFTKVKGDEYKHCEGDETKVLTGNLKNTTTGTVATVVGNDTTPDPGSYTMHTQVKGDAYVYVDGKDYKHVTGHASMNVDGSEAKYVAGTSNMTFKDSVHTYKGGVCHDVFATSTFNSAMILRMVLSSMMINSAALRVNLSGAQVNLSGALLNFGLLSLKGFGVDLSLSTTIKLPGGGGGGGVGGGGGAAGAGAAGASWGSVLASLAGSAVAGGALVGGAWWEKHDHDGKSEEEG